MEDNNGIVFVDLEKEDFFGYGIVFVDVEIETIGENLVMIL